MNKKRYEATQKMLITARSWFRRIKFLWLVYRIDSLNSKLKKLGGDPDALGCVWYSCHFFRVQLLKAIKTIDEENKTNREFNDIVKNYVMKTPKRNKKKT